MSPLFLLFLSSNFNTKIISCKEKYEPRLIKVRIFLSGADEGTNEPLLRERLHLAIVCERKRIFAGANIKGSSINLTRKAKKEG